MCSLCTNWFALSGCWYRGAVVGKDDDGSHIYFVDFGNTELVKKENIRNIFEELVKVPALAMICQLDGNYT